jgi:hypothetical protein
MKYETSLLLLVACLCSGFFTSCTDNSVSGLDASPWVQTSATGSYYSASCFAVSTPDLFVGTGGSGVFFSSDNGVRWFELIDVEYRPQVVFDVVVKPNSAGGLDLFAATYQYGVLLWTNTGTGWNAGTGWNTVNTGLRATHYVFALAVSDTNLFASTDSGVFLSTNNGTSWTEVTNGLTNTYVFDLFVSGANLFASTGDGLFLSTDQGTTWTVVNGSANLFATAFAVSPEGTNLFAGIDGGGIFLSTNNGTSWTEVNNGLTSLSVSDLAVSGASLFAGTLDGGVFLSSNNGTSWTTVNSGLTNSNVQALTVSGTNLYAGVGDGSIWRHPL